jgi:hypothetical protein
MTTTATDQNFAVEPLLKTDAGVIFRFPAGAKPVTWTSEVPPILMQVTHLMTPSRLARELRQLADEVEDADF